MKSLLFVPALFLFATPANLAPDEGMWMPAIVRDGASYEHLAERGLEVPAEKMWNPGGVSLTDAMLMFGQPSENPEEGISGYGSGAFVSSKGLALTNHHVAYDAIAGLSKPGEDLVEDGFVAKTMAEERHCKDLRVQLTTDIREVTKEVHSAVKGLDEMSFEARARAVAEAGAMIAEKARVDGAPAAVVKEMSEGSRFFLFTYDFFQDVRLVYAPPRSIGEHGGDIDNWMWPRHTGDFTYLRVYVAKDGSRAPYSEDNVPFEPEHHLKLTTKGVREGDFCFIMGHPGSTYRYRTSFSVNYREKVALPAQIAQLDQMRQNFEAQAAQSDEARLRVAPTLKSINNTLKNFQGTVVGLDKLDVVERRQAEEKRLQAWIDEDEGRKQRYGNLMGDFSALYEKLAANEREGFMNGIGGLRRKLRAAWTEFRRAPQYEDANMTLRLTYGSVKGYRPQDGVTYRHVTTARGILEKETGKAPFDAPSEQLELLRKRDFGAYADQELDSLVLCFLSDCDITGGNSGSPIMNGRGEMIGIAFDGNLEAITSDFKFENDLSRTISVDIRYVLWCTDKLAGLQRLLDEMQIVR